MAVSTISRLSLLMWRVMLLLAVLSTHWSVTPGSASLLSSKYFSLSSPTLSRIGGSFSQLLDGLVTDGGDCLSVNWTKTDRVDKDGRASGRPHVIARLYHEPNTSGFHQYTEEKHSIQGADVQVSVDNLTVSSLNQTASGHYRVDARLTDIQGRLITWISSSRHVQVGEAKARLVEDRQQRRSRNKDGSVTVTTWTRHRWSGSDISQGLEHELLRATHLQQRGDALSYSQRSNQHAGLSKMSSQLSHLHANNFKNF